LTQTAIFIGEDSIGEVRGDGAPTGDYPQAVRPLGSTSAIAALEHASTYRGVRFMHAARRLAFVG
jgi:hypothetical protein